MKILIPDVIKDKGKIEKTIFGKNTEVLICNATKTSEIKDNIWNNVDAILAFDTLNYDKYILSKLKKCKIIVRVGAGYDNVDLIEAKKRNIIVSNVPDYGIDEVADHALSLILSLNRNIFNFHEETKKGIWKRTGNKIFRLTGKTLGIIGLGRIGKAVALRAKAFKMNVIYYDPYLKSGYDKILNITNESNIFNLAKKSDFVSIHCPLTDETKNLINKSFFKKMKKTSIIVNTARGEVLNLNDLKDALKNKKIKGAALDVLQEEPLSIKFSIIKDYFENKKYLKNRLIITPHVAFYSTTSVVEIRKKAATEAKNVLNNSKPRNCLNGF
jgi:lactate dehydrogenase-like 2-hydroxyacid dehydrogenase